MTPHRILWKITSLCAVLALVFSTLSTAAAQPAVQVSGNDGGPTTPAGPAGDTLQQRLLQQRSVRQQGRGGSPASASASGVTAMSALGDQVVRVNIELNKPALASVSTGMTPAQRTAYAAEVAAYEDQAAAQITAAGGEVVYKFHTLSTGLIARMPGRLTAVVSRMPQVSQVSQIFDYKQDLANTVPFIGATAVKAAGFDGTGVKVAVLDSGIDYTHKAFGGPGTVTAWETAYYGSPACKTAFGRTAGCANSKQPDPSLFGPAAPRVKGGYDWVGPTWPITSTETPDANPIANQNNPATGDEGDHGTHVADIIGGNAYSGQGEGVAPGVSLYAFTVCSSVSPACSGVAILEGLDNASDLDGNPATKDPADVVNLSLGEPYGQPESSDAYLVNQLVSYGSVVVVSAGNDGDKPYIVGGPSSASGSISVAETTVPGTTGYLIQSPSWSAPYPVSIWQTWSKPITADTSAVLTYDASNAGTRQGCSDLVGTNPWTGTPLAGKVVLMDRGTCPISWKVANAHTAGAVLALVADNEPAGLNDLPPSFSAGGGDTSAISGLILTQSDGGRLKTALAGGVVSVTVPSAGSSLAYTVASTSSRGPRNQDNLIKPDIAAPGASVSAVAGTGTLATAFGGTSGAAPMVTGVVALMKQVHGDAQNFTAPHLTPQQYKALLMNTANTQIYKDGAAGGYLAPISRIGGGQVDAEKALKTDFIAWDSTDPDPLKWTGSLSFGYQPVTSSLTLTRKLTIDNLNPLEKQFFIDPTFRYANDTTKGVSISVNPNYVVVPANSKTTVDVVMTIDLSAASTLPTWPSAFNRGVSGYNGYELDQVEVDGYLNVYQALGGVLLKNISVPWQVLPKVVADLSAVKTAPGSIVLTNHAGYLNGNTMTFSLLDESPDNWGYNIGDCSSVLLPAGCNLSLVDLKDVGITYDSSQGMLYFGLSVWDAPYRSSQYPVGYNIYLDTNHDGKEDYVIFTADQNQDASDGRSAVFYQPVTQNIVNGQPVVVSTGPEVFYGYVIGNFDSNNTIIPLPTALLNINPSQQLNFYVIALDTYFSDPYYDIAPVDHYYYNYTPLQPRYVLQNPANLNPVVPGGGTTQVLYWTALGSAAMPSGSQIGFLFMNNDAPVGKESTIVQLGTPVYNIIWMPKIEH